MTYAAPPSSLVVLIPTAGRPDLLRRTLSSLSASEPAGVCTRTIVVENGEPAGARDVAHEFESYGVEYRHVPAPNKSAALNAALDEISSDDVLVFFTDDDVRFAPETLSAIVRAARSVNGAAVFGGPVRIDYEVCPPSWLHSFLPRSAKGWDVMDEQAWAKWPYFLGCNWAAFAGDLKAAGGFDPRFGPGSPTRGTGQEREIQARLRDAGLPSVRVPEAVVWHWVPKDRCTPCWVLERQYRNGVQVAFERAKAGGDTRASRIVVWSRVFVALVRAGVSGLNRDPAARHRALGRLYYRMGVAGAMGKLSRSAKE